MKKLVNGVEVDCSENDIAQINQLQSEWDSGTAQRMIDSFTKALEQFINEKVAEKSYSSGVSCASYKDSTNTQWASEAQAFVVWRDQCYEYGYNYLAEAQSGQIPNPNLEDFLAGLPTMEWPN